MYLSDAQTRFKVLAEKGDVPKAMAILDDEERTILQAFESGEFKSVLTDERKFELIEVAKANLNKRKCVE